ncbi:uncharacterized protein LOC141588821 [Silene latifolia]|uniref:uncharacterized protein LOC141588821 n=1 Tax=Silene latifolia TaxID=37657 RepID=UPI003D77531B
MDLTDNSCPRCANCVETCLHVVRDCGWVEGIWEELGVDVLQGSGCGEVREWAEAVFRGSDMRECGVFMTGCWAIWEKRNKVLFDEGEWRGDEVVRRTREILWEMEGAIEGREKGGGRKTQEDGGGRWERPGAGWCKINVDAGVAEGMGTGIGVVCRDELGSVHWGVAVQEERVVSSDVAEALAILQGLKEAKLIWNSFCRAREWRKG